MKTNLIVTLLAAFLVNALGEDRDTDWGQVKTDFSAPMVTEEEIEISEIKKMANRPTTLRSAVKLAGINPVNLPSELPLGSRRKARDFMVATNGLGAQVTVGFVVYLTPTNPFSTTTFRRFVGFASYEDFLADVKVGMELVLAKFSTNQFSPDTIVYSRILVSYFSDNPGSGLPSFALSMINPASSFAELNIENAMTAVGIDSPTVTEMLIIPIPKLESVAVRVQLDTNTIAAMDWSERNGVELSTSWKEKSPREFTTSYFLYLRNWVFLSTNYVRVTLKLSEVSGGTYTQYGGKILPPHLSLEKDGTITILATPGSNVAIEASKDFATWHHQVQVIFGVVGSQKVKITNLDLPLAFLRGISF